ncbi:MAG: DNA polymerase I [Bdellovibrionales bacterium]
MKKKLFLVDVSSLYFRAYYAIRPLSNTAGLPTNALYGFISMSVKLLRELKPDYMAYCFDRKEPSFRYEIAESYKANRSEMPPDLQLQVPYIAKITDALGIPSYSLARYEADDVIGTLAVVGEKAGLEVIIVSGDKDFGQLVNPNVRMYDPMKEITYDEAGVFEKMGVRPDQIVDYLSIVGDTSDNIKGVAGIGPKGAQKLLAKFGNLDEVYKRLDEVQPPGVAQKLKDGKKSAELAKRLAAIDLNVPIKVEAKDLALRPFQREELQALLRELEFKNFEKTLLGTTLDGEEAGKVEAISKPAKKSDKPKKTEEGASGHPIPAATTTGDVRYPQPKEQEIEADKIGSRIPNFAEVWVISTQRGLCLGFENKAYIVQGDVKEVGKILSQKELKWKGFDLKNFWRDFDITGGVGEWDHMLAAYVVRPAAIESFEKVHAQYLSPLPEIPSFSHLYEAHQRLEISLHNKLQSVNGEKVYRDMELPLAKVLWQMERRGILIDKNILSEQNKVILKDIQAIEKEVFEEVGENFNLGSPKQLGHILFEKMKMPVGRKTKTGYSTDSDVLEKLAKDYPICKRIIEHRELNKLKSTYIESLPQLIDPSSGRVHTHFNQAVTSTGRLSSTNPNLQNIPIRTERGSAIRQAFVAPEGKALISADYSQIELRVLAHIAEDKNLRKAFENNVDIHSATASEVFGVKLQDVTSDLRRTAKAINFGIAYGMGVYGLAENLSISREEASDIIKRYFVKFSGVKDYMTSVVEEAKSKGYVETLYGRRRYMDELFSTNARVKQFGERAAINAPIQGTASDIVKKAMIDLGDYTKAPMLLQVHDELIFEASVESAEKEAAHIKEVMESAASLAVPLVVHAGTGKNWEDAH